MQKVNRRMEEPGNLMVGTWCGSNADDCDEVGVVMSVMRMHLELYIN